MTSFDKEFPRAAAYAAVRPSAFRVKEPQTDAYGFQYTERHIQCVWYDDTWRPKPLFTTEGEEVTVEKPGDWNLEAGPDFLNASLVVGPEQRRFAGDVEVHVSPADWQRHGHSGDARYRRVVCHVTYFGGGVAHGNLPPGAVEISLKDALSATPFFSFESIDTTAYPFASYRKAAPCAKALAARSPSELTVILESAGEERVRQKACRMVREIEERGKEQAFYAEVLSALGFKNNRVQFRQLAGRVPVQRLCVDSSGDATRAYALLLGVSGLLPAKVSHRWDAATRTRVRRLWDHWWKIAGSWERLAMPRGVWSLSGLRPQNHPIRRMVAAASLFCCGPALSERLVALKAKGAREWIRAALGLVRNIQPDAYWRNRLSFGRPPAEKEIVLIGAGRAASILVNVLVPFVAASGSTPGAYEEILRCLPEEEENALVRQCASELLGRDHDPKVYRSALRQQGLLQIFHDFCLNDRSDCRSCPLPQAIEEW